MDDLSQPRKKISKSDCHNESLMERIKSHLKIEYSLGECTIVSKIEQQSADIELLKQKFKVIKIEPSTSPNNSKSKFEKKLTRN